MPDYRAYYSGSVVFCNALKATDDIQALILARSMGGRDTIITRLLRDDGEGAGWVWVFPEGDKPSLLHPPSLDPRDFIEMPKIGEPNADV